MRTKPCRKCKATIPAATLRMYCLQCSPSAMAPKPEPLATEPLYTYTEGDYTVKVLPPAEMGVSFDIPQPLSPFWNNGRVQPRALSN